LMGFLRNEGYLKHSNEGRAAGIHWCCFNCPSYHTTRDAEIRQARTALGVPPEHSSHILQNTIDRDAGAPVKKGELGCMRRDPSTPLRWSALRIPIRVASTPSRAIAAAKLPELPSCSSSPRRSPRFNRFSSAPGDGFGRASGPDPRPRGGWAGER
jgi:hypothetical protein